MNFELNFKNNILIRNYRILHFRTFSRTYLPSHHHRSNPLCLSEVWHGGYFFETSHPTSRRTSRPLDALTWNGFVASNIRVHFVISTPVLFQTEKRGGRTGGTTGGRTGGITVGINARNHLIYRRLMLRTVGIWHNTQCTMHNEHLTIRLNKGC